LQGNPNLQYFQITLPGSRTVTPPYQWRRPSVPIVGTFVLTINVPLFKKLWDLIFFLGTITLGAVSRDAPHKIVRKAVSGELGGQTFFSNTSQGVLLEPVQRPLPSL
jgi:hypothetical protein